MSALRYRYQTIEFDNNDIHVRTLRDLQQFSDDGAAEKLGINSSLWPLFGVIWDSSEVLAHQMVSHDIVDKRILEVGCGIGLASLLLNQRLADITATDYHPEAGKFLNYNTHLNNDRTIPFVRTGWADEDEQQLGQFDLIIGSDLLYQQDNIELLSHFIHQHCKTKCEVILVDPGRGNHAKFSKRMIELGYQHSQKKPTHTDYLKSPFKGQIITYRRGFG